MSEGEPHCNQTFVLHPRPKINLLRSGGHVQKQSVSRHPSCSLGTLYIAQSFVIRYPLSIIRQVLYIVLLISTRE
jgi:hypothetical protein